MGLGCKHNQVGILRIENSFALSLSGRGVEDLGSFNQG